MVLIGTKRQHSWTIKQSRSWHPPLCLPPLSRTYCGHSPKRPCLSPKPPGTDLHHHLHPVVPSLMPNVISAAKCTVRRNSRSLFLRLSLCRLKTKGKQSIKKDGFAVLFYVQMVSIYSIYKNKPWWGLNPEKTDCIISLLTASINPVLQLCMQTWFSDNKMW